MQSDSKDASRWRSNGTTWGRYHQGKLKKCAIEALKEGLRGASEMYGEENIISAVIHVDETTPHLALRDFVPLTAGESIGERRDRLTKKMRRTQENFLKQCKKGCLALNLMFGVSEKSIILTACDQKFTKR